MREWLAYGLGNLGHNKTSLHSHLHTYLPTYISVFMLCLVCIIEQFPSSYISPALTLLARIQLHLISSETVQIVSLSSYFFLYHAIPIFIHNYYLLLFTKEKPSFYCMLHQLVLHLCRETFQRIIYPLSSTSSHPTLFHSGFYFHPCQLLFWISRVIYTFLNQVSAPQSCSGQASSPQLLPLKITALTWLPVYHILLLFSYLIGWSLQVFFILFFWSLSAFGKYQFFNYVFSCYI